LSSVPGLGLGIASHHIRTLRKALQDDAANPAYIATVRSIGYRLIAPSPS
jgi:DNA-binding response OmpR family regulator